MEYRIKKEKLLHFLVVALVAPIAVQAQEEGALSRREVVELSLAHSYAIKNNTLEVQKVNRDRQKTWQTFLPTVTLNGSYTHLNDDISMSVPPISLALPGLGTLPPITLNPITLQKQDILKTDVTAQMVLFTGLKVTYGLQALRHQSKAIEALNQKNKADVFSEAITTYDRLAVISQSEKVLEESEARLKKEAEFAEKALKQGLITPYDQSKIEIARQELEAKKMELQTARQLTLSKLSQLTGKSAISFQNILPSLNVWVPDNLPADQYQNPQLLALEEASKAQQSKHRMTMSGYLPVVYAFGKKEMITEDLSALDPEWAVGVGLKWNLFDGLQTYRDRQKAALDEAMAHNNYSSAEELLALKLEKTRQEYELAAQLIKVAVQKKATASKGLEIATRQYQNGLGSITERLAAETDFQNAALDLIQATYRQRMAAMALLETSGKLNIESLKD